jgi:two-component system alkaline phosphatase synthesis response regulator PhoP
LLPLLRRLTESPIIVLGSGGEMAMVRALFQGADFYLTRPVNVRELIARIRALLRR